MSSAASPLGSSRESAKQRTVTSPVKEINFLWSVRHMIVSVDLLFPFSLNNLFGLFLGPFGILAGFFCGQKKVPRGGSFSLALSFILPLFLKKEKQELSASNLCSFFPVKNKSEEKGISFFHEIKKGNHCFTDFL